MTISTFMTGHQVSSHSHAATLITWSANTAFPRVTRFDWNGHHAQQCQHWDHAWTPWLVESTKPVIWKLKIPITPAPAVAIYQFKWGKDPLDTVSNNPIQISIPYMKITEIQFVLAQVGCKTFSSAISYQAS